MSLIFVIIKIKIIIYDASFKKQRIKFEYLETRWKLGPFISCYHFHNSEQNSDNQQAFTSTAQYMLFYFRWNIHEAIQICWWSHIANEIQILIQKYLFHLSLTKRTS